MLIAEHSPRSGAPVNLGQANAVIIVFVMEGCGACEAYVPQFQAVAQEFNDRVPAFILDVNSQQGHSLADQFEVMATPTTMVLRRPVGAIKAEGALSPAQIRQLFSLAAQSR